MTVAQLISILETLDPEAPVLIMMQRHWPFEVALHGVAVRDEFALEDEGGQGGALRDGAPPKRPSDVFLVEGEQLRYGNSAAWEAARRQ